ncbi:DUF6454 family protein [Nocardioidaceae bacterium SCSIO 66511]|nr:DUF6454 family protein [Nocardioidaceae bacterium SCSIO 66511]
MRTLAITVAAACLLASSGAAASPSHDREPLADRVASLTRDTTWTQVDRISLDFDTYHPQGMALVGDRIFISSVEVIEAPQRYPEPIDGYDRSPGKGVGHLFVLNRDGELLDDIELGAGDSYHPGGIDYDGRDVWVPVAEYRPDSAATVYRVDPETLDVDRAFEANDHIGGVVRDQVSGRVHGVSWGSRTMYSWTPHGRQLDRAPNRDHMLDYQDCAYVAFRKQLCTGVTGLPTADGGSYELGGLALLDLRSGSMLHEVPFQQFSSAGHVMTRNPVAVETTRDGLRMFAAPDDGEDAAGTELYVYETERS